jgi:3-hydroxyacyl-[acyl-carrier-protein] dehydratase
MSLMPEILAVRRSDDTQSVALELHVAAGLDYFQGHFPGLPILPGVVQVDWAMRFAEQHLNALAIHFAGLKALKFTAPVRPDTVLTLELRLNTEAKRVEFSFFDAKRKYSSGQITMKPTLS